MKVDVLFGAGGLTPAEMHGRVVVVIDVLRASTSIAVALFNGARSVVPFDSADEVVAHAKSFDRELVVLAGERRMQPIPGFDLGNSPRSFSVDAIAGKSVLLTTSNGTAALLATQGAAEVFVGAFVNFGAILQALEARLRPDAHVVFLCAGSERAFSLEDAVCAGRFVRGLVDGGRTLELNDAARAAILLERRYATDLRELFADAAHGRALDAAGYGDDLTTCRDLDQYPVVPIYVDRLITRMTPPKDG